MTRSAYRHSHTSDTAGVNTRSPMTPVRQRITADPDRGDGANRAGVPGDCLRAAVATLLEHPYEQVPHFALYGPTWWDQLRRWARTAGGDFAVVPVVAGSVRYALAGDGLVLARGPSPRTRGHVVVATVDLVTLWDPHPSDAGLLDIDEVYVYVPPYWPPPEQRAITAHPHQQGGSAPMPPRPTPPAPDLSVFKRVVRFRDRAVALATAYHARVGLRPSQHYARATYDAIAELIREDERKRLAAAGRLQPAPLPAEDSRD